MFNYKCCALALTLVIIQQVNLNNGQAAPPNAPIALPPEVPSTKPPLQVPQTTTITNSLIEKLLTGGSGVYVTTEAEFPGFDGWYNNLARPDSGAIDRPLLRRWPASYEDGVYEPAGQDRPNPLTLSEELLKGEIGTQTKTGKNALVVFFGQQVVEEILDAQRPACPPEYFNIFIPENHTYREVPGHTELPFLRTRYDQRTGFSPNNPRQQLNEITPYLDGGLMYGITKQWSDQLRTNEDGTLDKDGLLASSYDGLFPAYNTDRLPMANPPPPFHHKEMVMNHELKPISRFFKLGNPRGNENTFLLTFGVLWFRWHNVLAKQIRTYQPTWTSERVFNEARKWVIATQQHIVVDEWLPTWTNRNLAKYSGYDASVDPQIDQMFQSAAFRFGHTLVPPAVYMRDYSRYGCTHTLSKQLGTNAVRTCNSFWRPQDALLKPYNDSHVLDIDRMLMGLAHQLCEMDDHKIVEDLRGNVFGPLEFPRRDLMAVNVQRGRDHGIPDFNSARRAFGLQPIISFEHFVNVNKDIRDKAAELYKNDVNNIDLWIGGIFETTEQGPGELFSTIIIDQFTRIRNADRFWYENYENGLFTTTEVSRLKELTMRSIILSVTKLDEVDLPEEAFFVGSTIPSNCTDFVRSTCTAKIFTNKICYHLPQPNQVLINESCVQGQSYDYFSNSEISYILSFAALGAAIVGLGTFIYIKLRLVKINPTTAAKNNMLDKSATSFSVMAKEWLGPNKLKHNVIIKFNQTDKALCILEYDGQCRRLIICSNRTIKKVHSPPDKPHFMIITEQEYDLVVEFPTFFIRDGFIEAFLKFLNEVDYPQSDFVNDVTTNVSEIMSKIVSKEDRQKLLEDFIRIVFAQAFKIDLDVTQLLKDGLTAKQIATTELTLLEFAETLNLSPTHTFVTKMFHLVDKDRNGLVSYREFVDMLIIFANGNETKKAELLFKMYDVNATGQLGIEDFEDMIRSFLEMVNGNIVRKDLQNTIIDMMTRAGLSHKKALDFGDFQKLVGSDFAKLKEARLEFQYSKTNNPLSTARQSIEEIYSAVELQARIAGNVNSSTDDAKENFNKMIDKDTKQTTKTSSKTKLLEKAEKYSKKFFWFGLYTLVLWAVFAERAYYYSTESEHTGLRRIAGYGVTITRGAASAMMFTYSSLLVTVSKNLITFLRETVLHQYFPFDSYIEFHKYIAYWALFFTVFHIIGHAFNFYHIATQTSDDLTCLFRNYFHSTHEIPKFHYWCWQTMTGFTGIILTIITAVIFIFSLPIVRRKLYEYFWYSHTLYVPFYIFMVLHGTGRLIQEPFFHYFFLGPVILFTIDKIVVLSRNKVLIPVISAELLPSDVTKLVFKRPENFGYKAGQYVRIACVSLNSNDYHPFTLTSSPNETNLTVHIRSVGPWTRNIRKIYNSMQLSKIYLDGPYGEEHQHWYEYDVSIFVGSGIGVTPFASILKDIVFRASIQPNIRSKKVYFFWVSRAQRQFEWLMELLKDIEEKDIHNIITTHIFITQFYEKFDIRMTMLYICERHYQRLANKSLFTNLRAVTHFGRPKFAGFFKSIKGIHSEAKQIGVFSCGSSTVTSTIDVACSRINKNSAGPNLNHHYQNF